MKTNGTSEVIVFLRRTALLTEAAAASDAQLLGDFIDRRDEPALEALVRRHGPMVWGVCRRLLSGHHDAEDAFQATFLVLVRKAASVAPREMVANWLYGVARQTALKARAAAARQRGREAQVAELPEPAVSEPEPSNDLHRWLDEELSRLPQAYRAAVVLCDLEGLSRKEAAHRLGLAEGTVASRVARGREMLARRLTRRGVASVGVAVLSEGLAPACPPALLSSLVNAAAPVSIEVAALAQGVIESMFLVKLKFSAVILALAGTLAVAIGWQATRNDARVQAGELPTALAARAEGDEKPPEAAGEIKVRATIETPGGHVKSLAFSPDGKSLTSLGKEGPTWTPWTWDPATGGGQRLIEYGHEIYSLTYSPDGKTMAWGCNDRALKVWDVEAGKEKANFADRSVTSVAFSPDGKELASTHKDGTVRARDLATGKEWIIQQHGSRVFSLTYSADGKALAWACDDGSLRVWDVAANKEKVHGKNQNVTHVRFSPDGKTLAAAGSWGESVKLLDAASGKELTAFKVDRDQVTCMVFSPDGKVLATAGNRGTILLWDVAANKDIAVLKGSVKGGVSSLAFSPDGKTLASGGIDKTISLWDMPAQ